ncbi:MAG TPA: type VI secretion system baseplate subunit TssK [Thermohalobaculum sp.]|nr:type VI secretion system baseplate subunit TssK [Thermohalobaculum sp.]
MAAGNRVLWSEGLFLRAQHFQQQDRWTEGLVRGAWAAAALPAWGFRTLRLDGVALETGRIAVEAAAGIFPDGTPFAIPDLADPPEPLMIDPKRTGGPVLLALPVEQAGVVSFDPAHLDPSGARYRGQAEPMRDAVARGADPEEIEIARPQFRLLGPGEDASGFTALALCEVQGVKADGAVALAEDFLPPATTAAAASNYQSWLREIATGLERIAEAHGEIVRGGTGRSIENLLILELANAAHPRIAHMAAQQAFHPSELFLELSGLAGRMATFGSGSRSLTALPPYRHDAPGPAFAALIDTMRSLVLTLRRVEPKSFALPTRRHEQNVWKIRIDNPAILKTSRIVLRVGAEMSEDALRQIFVNQATVGSAEQFEGLWRSRLPGIPLRPLHSQPREIPYDGERLCLELDRHSEHWEPLANSVGFMIGVSGELPKEPVVDCYAVSR